jgi:hypothetical protein
MGTAGVTEAFLGDNDRATGSVTFSAARWALRLAPMNWHKAACPGKGPIPFVVQSTHVIQKTTPSNIPKST